MSSIFTKLKIKNVIFKNRIVMAPMVRFGQKCENGIMGEELLNEYLNAADKEIGLIISQALCVSPNGLALGRPCVYDESHVEYIRKISRACHKNGTAFFVQLSYPGFAFNDKSSKDINSLTTNELKLIKEEFVNAAYICKEAEVDGVEFHGAHTFFLNMITSGKSNKRNDIYGGSLLERLNFVKEIIDSVNRFSDDDFIISYRMGWTDSLDEDILTAKALENLGINMIHISSGIPSDRKLNLPNNFEFNDIVYTACKVKKHINIATIAVNDIRTLKRGNELIKTNSANFVAYGKPFLADPSFVLNSEKNMEYESCLKCKTCAWFTDGSKCPGRKRL